MVTSFKNAPLDFCEASLAHQWIEEDTGTFNINVSKIDLFHHNEMITILYHVAICSGRILNIHVRKCHHEKGLYNL